MQVDLLVGQNILQLSVLSHRVCLCLQYKSFNCLPHNLNFLRSRRKKPFEKNVGKGENVGYQQYLLLPQCLLPYKRQKLSF